jgi:hypothetical protein
MYNLALLIRNWHYSRYENFGQYTGAPNPAPLIVAGPVSGIGIGGFIDGTVLHRLLQWLGMPSKLAASCLVRC